MTAPATSRTSLPAGVAWHGAFAAAVGLALAGLTLGGRLESGSSMLALVLAGAAAALGALLALAGRPGRMAAVAVWALAGGAACHLTGGPAGPLAVWCLAPAAAGAAFRKREMLSLGAAASLAAAAVSALDASLFALPAADAAAAPWMALTALATMAIGLAAGLVAVQGEVRRDTRRKARSEALLDILDHQPLLFALADRNGRVRSAAGAVVGGFSPAQIEGRSLGHLVAEADLPALAGALHEAANAGRAQVYVEAAEGPDGWLDIGLMDRGGGLLVASVRDARDQRGRERRLEAARLAAEQQNAGKSRFLANMSHELRTPLNAIMGFSDIMRQRLFGPIGDRYAEYADLIHESGTHLLELINDVLDMSKIEAERFELVIETFDARDAVNAVLRLMRGQADRAGVNLRGVLPIGPLYADADRRAVKQIALNLISNALKFTPRGGSVTVTVQGAADILELVVSDTGVGIAQDDLARIGQPFEQAGEADKRAEGTGLGLSLVRAFARLHNGEMTVESAVGEGTSVTIRLPVLVQAAPERERRQG